MMFGKMSKHQYADDYVSSNMVELFLSNRVWIFAVSYMVAPYVGLDDRELQIYLLLEEYTSGNSAIL
jgi:hypothetical protein